MEAYLREATEKDVDILFQWVNDPLARKNQFSTKQIPYEEHQEWYKRLLDSKNSKQYIYMYGKNAVGEARIAIHGNEAEISYSICREKRCMGHGKNVLRLLCRQVKKDFPHVQKLIARVKPDNIASQQAFLEVGYTEKYSVFELEIYHMDIAEDYGKEESFRGGIFLNK